MAVNTAYTELPAASDIREQIMASVEYWKPRNTWMTKVQKMLNGENEVKGPEKLKFKVEVTHTGLLAAAVAEKAARFSLRPEIAVIPNSYGTEARDESTELEKAINSCFYWMEIQGDADVWGSIVLDCIAFDGGVERIEACPASAWPDITQTDPKTKREMLYAKSSRQSAKEYTKLRHRYKQQSGVPFRSVYVPLNCFFPVYDGPKLCYSFEFEKRSLRSVLDNPLFQENIGELIGYAKGIKPAESIKTQVTIVHYVNSKYHAYYALAPVTSRPNEAAKWPEAEEASEQGVGRPVFLYSYAHNLGRSIYNVVGGRFGGWKTDHNRIESVMNLLVQLNEDADYLASQTKTNLRATGWGSFVVKFDPDLRDATDHSPEAPSHAEGEDVLLWKTEDMAPLLEPRQNPILQWHYSNILNSIERLSGSPAIYGQHQAGVTTGYHASLQITQAEHLDERLEQHLVQGAIQRAMILLSHVRELGEVVPVMHRIKDDNGRVQGKFVDLDPAQLDPLPMLDASVKKPRPTDYSVAVRTALDASMDRHGPGTPLLDDDSIRERILGEDAPDVIEKKIAIQNEKQKLIASGALSQKITEKLNLILAANSKPAVGAEQVQNADPALLGALQQMNAGSGEAAQLGGVSPNSIAAQVQGGQAAGVPQTGHGAAGPPPPSPANIMQPGPSPYTGRGGGVPMGGAQPENAQGRALASAVRGGPPV